MVTGPAHILIKTLPRYAVGQFLGYMKGKSARAMARKFVWQKRDVTEEMW
jgi:transposase